MASPNGAWFGHGGGHPAASADLWVAPAYGLSFVVLTNYDLCANYVSQTIMDLAASTDFGGRQSKL
jgi:hypothetical protein